MKEFNQLKFHDKINIVNEYGQYVTCLYTHGTTGTALKWVLYVIHGKPQQLVEVCLQGNVKPVIVRLAEDLERYVWDVKLPIKSIL